MTNPNDDPRIDPRIKATMLRTPPTRHRDVASREELLAELQTPDAIALREMAEVFWSMFDTEDNAPSTGLTTTEHEFTSSPDGNRIRVKLIRPDGDEAKPCVVYLHGGGMAIMSAFNGMYTAWGRFMASHGYAVAMVDFRNSQIPSTAEEVAPYPAGLNDCVSGVKWVVASAASLGLDPERVIVAGESGGGNLTLATGMKLLRDGDIDLIRGLYAMCPFIAGSWPQARFPSSIEFDGVIMHLHHNRWRMGYGIEAFEAGDPLAWPSFATEADVTGLPPTVISVNEIDPLRDEGIEFARLLERAGVRTECRTVMGTVHGTEIFTIARPDISHETAASIGAFLDSVSG